MGKYLEQEKKFKKAEQREVKNSLIHSLGQSASTS